MPPAAGTIVYRDREATCKALPSTGEHSASDINPRYSFKHKLRSNFNRYPIFTSLVFGVILLMVEATSYDCGGIHRYRGRISPLCAWHHARDDGPERHPRWSCSSRGGEAGSRQRKITATLSSAVYLSRLGISRHSHSCNAPGQVRQLASSQPERTGRAQGRIIASA